MKQQPIDKYFTNKMFRRQFYPALIAAVVLSFGDVADGLVLGNSIGHIGLAAIALSMPVAQIFNVIMNGLGIGGSVRFSNQMAQGKRDEAISDFQGVVITGGIAGIIIGVLGNVFMTGLLFLLGTKAGDGELYNASMTYLRILLAGTPFLFLNYILNYYMKNDDLEKQASLAFTVGNIVDISLNIILVLIIRIGVAGASIATVSGQFVSMVISIIIIAKRGKTLTFSHMKPRFKYVFNSFGKGFFSSIEFLYSLVFLLIANHLLLTKVGGFGVAIFDIVLSISFFMINICDASAKSSLPVVSTYYGECNEHGTKNALYTGIRYVVISSLVLALIVFFLPKYVCLLFGLENSELVQMGINAVKWYALSIPIAGVNILLSCFNEAIFKEKDTLLINTMRGVLPIVFAIVFLFLSYEWFWSLYLFTESLTLITYVVFSLIRRKKLLDERIVYRKTLSSTSSEISETTLEMQEFCEKYDIPPKKQMLIAMATEEICVATLDNGFRGKGDGFIQITLVLLEDGDLRLHIRDNASTFNPLSLEMNEKKNIMDVDDFSALGMSVIKKKAKDFSYRHYQGFNTVIILI